MNHSKHTTCLNCGMRLGRFDVTCPKCDNNLTKQTDGSTITLDIAHHGERVADALRKLREVLAAAGIAQNLRIIVGSGHIREAALYALQDELFRGHILAVDIEPGNAGAIMVRRK